MSRDLAGQAGFLDNVVDNRKNVSYSISQTSSEARPCCFLRILAWDICSNTGSRTNNITRKINEAGLQGTKEGFYEFNEKTQGNVKNE